MEKIIYKPIGIIHSPFKISGGTPIQPTAAKDIKAIRSEYTLQDSANESIYVDKDSLK